MFPDRLEVRNPGGLFGPVAVEDLTTAATSSARNGALYKILESVSLPHGGGTVCENRGSGIQAMIASLRSAGMSLPIFTDEIASFRVVFPNATLLDDDTVKWLAGLGQVGLTDSQILALARMRRGETLKNATYRAQTGVDSRVATAELRDLVDRRLVAVDGTRGAATYCLTNGEHSRPNRARQMTLDDETADSTELSSTTTEPALPRLAVATWHALSDGPKTRQELQDALDLAPHQVLYRLRLLRKAGLVGIDGPSRSPDARWHRRAQH
jgi:ATP-dependent DNA helicase RecG